jgi:hypothetical protein
MTQFAAFELGDGLEQVLREVSPLEQGEQVIFTEAWSWAYTGTSVRST